LPYLLVLPSLGLIALINLYPLATGFWYSLQNGTLIKLGSFVGLENYAQLIGRPEFIHALWFSAVFALFAVFGSWLLGLALALLLNRPMPGQGFFRVALLLPWIIPSVVSIVSWRWLLNDQSGLMNAVLGVFGLQPQYLLSSEPTAILSIFVVKIWRSFPFMMLSLLAAIQVISLDLYEAAKVDGANRWQSFRHITLPQIRNLSIVLWILMTIWSVNDFDTPWLLTQGGPSGATENLSVLAFRYTFKSSDLGLGSATAFTSMLVLMVLAVILLRRQREA